MATRLRRAPRPARLATLTAATAVPCLLAATLIAAPAQAARPAQAPAPIQPLLLPGTETVVTAADVSPEGVIVGTAGPADPLTNPTGSTVHRWLPEAAGYTGQQLPSPEGATGTWAKGVTDRGEAGGTAVFGATRRATRWSSDGQQPTLIGAENSETSAVGPGQWLVDTAVPPARTVEIVAPDGARTPISGISPDLREPHGRLVGGPFTALVLAATGTGILATALGFTWQAGWISFLPTVANVFSSPLCYSPLHPDGAVAFSGMTLFGAQVVGTQRGWSTELLPTAGLVGRLGCENDDTMAADGWIAGSLAPTDNQAAREPVLWRPDRSLVRLGRATDETAAVSVAVATGGRAVVRATLQDGASRLVLWQQGVRTPLALPAGWSLAKVVELTDTGVVVANLTGPDGRRRPAVWRT